MEPVAPVRAARMAGGPKGWAAGRGRWMIAGVALAILAPLVWSGAATRPLVSSGLTGGASGAVRAAPAKGVGPLLDHEAPDFTLNDPSGKPVRLKQLRGQAVLLNFWATWCGPCREEMPEFEQLYRQYKDHGLVVLAVSIDGESSAKHVPDYLKEGNPRVGAYTFPVALDTKQDVARTYRLGGVPSSFFVDQAGVIRAVQPGAMSRQTILERLGTVLAAVR